MGRVMRVEAKKLMWNRSAWGIVAAMLGVATLAALQTASPAEEGKALWERQAFFFATIYARMFLLVLGAKVVTDEFRHGTIISAVLITPKRDRYVAAKLGVLAVAGVVGAALTAAVVVVTSWPHLGNGLQADEIRSLAGFVVSGGLWAVVGGAIGFVVRHQVGAIVGLLVWSVAIDQILAGRLGDLEKYLPSNAGGALVLANSVKAMLLGGLILVAYTVGAAVVGSIVMQRRDVV